MKDQHGQQGKSPRLRRLNNSIESPSGREVVDGEGPLGHGSRSMGGDSGRNFGGSVRRSTSGGMMPALPAHRVSPRGPGGASLLSGAPVRLSTWTFAALEGDDEPRRLASSSGTPRGCVQSSTHPAMLCSTRT